MVLERVLVLVIAAGAAAAAGAGAAWYSGAPNRDQTANPTISADEVRSAPPRVQPVAPATLAAYGDCGPVLQWCATADRGAANGDVGKACDAIKNDVLGNLGAPSARVLDACREIAPTLNTHAARSIAGGASAGGETRTCAWVYKRCSEIDPNRNPVLAVAGGAEFCGMLQFAYMMKRGTNPEMERGCAKIAHYFEPGALPELPAGMPATGGLFGNGLQQQPVYFEVTETVEYVE